MTNVHAPHTAPEFHTLSRRPVLVIDGGGAPESDAFQTAVRELDRYLGTGDVLQGTYWSGDDPLTFDLEDPHAWRWSLAVPAGTSTTAPDGTGPASAPRPMTLPAQRIARLVHHGPYVEEGPSLAALYAFIATHNLMPSGAHTEVYLTDPRETEASALRTELQVPVC